MSKIKNNTRILIIIGKADVSGRKLLTYPKNMNSLIPIPAGTPIKNNPIQIARK